MASFAERMLGAAKLDVRTYEEVEADTTATMQALGVVLISSIAAGIGGIGMGVSILRAVAVQPWTGSCWQALSLRPRGG